MLSRTRRPEAGRLGRLQSVAQTEHHHVPGEVGAGGVAVPLVAAGAGRQLHALGHVIVGGNPEVVAVALAAGAVEVAVQAGRLRTPALVARLLEVDPRER